MITMICFSQLRSYLALKRIVVIDFNILIDFLIFFLEPLDESTHKMAANTRLLQLFTGNLGKYHFVASKLANKSLSKITKMTNRERRIHHEGRAQQERTRENVEKIKMNKQLPYLVGNVIEILEPNAEDGEHLNHSSL